MYRAPSLSPYLQCISHPHLCFSRLTCRTSSPSPRHKSARRLIKASTPMHSRGTLYMLILNFHHSCSPDGFVEFITCRRRLVDLPESVSLEGPGDGETDGEIISSLGSGGWRKCMCEEMTLFPFICFYFNPFCVVRRRCVSRLLCVGVNIRWCFVE